MPNLNETFNGLAEGAAITSANVAFGQYTGNLAAVADTVQKFAGSASFRRPAVSGTSGMQITSGTDFTTQYLRLYLRPFQQASVSSILAFFDHSTTGYACDVRVLNDGRVQLRNSSFSLIQNSTSTLPLDAWSRIEIAAVNGTLTVRLFIGDPQATTPTETMSGTYVQTSMNRVAVGGTNTAVWGFNMDEVALSESGWIGPAAVSTTTPFLYYDNGTSFVDVSNNVWYHNGTAWVQVSLV